ncbi:MAG: valine--tRNA ligase [Methylovirgula sp.]
MDKTFDPATVERRISALWERAQAFRAGRPERRSAPPFCVVIPPPNVTGALHMGHALNNTLQDILCRFERMRGKDVLWQPGTDHAGIATQMVVERQLAERGNQGRLEMGREKFLEEVWRWKEESGGAIVSQLKRLGASCDWSRERFTLDEGLSRAVVKVFVQLYREGLIYKDKRLVNWDPKLQTAISDLEVVQVETKGYLWYFHYPLADKTFNPDDPSTYIVVATTRPETMLGDTAVAVHPDDPRYKHLVGKKVRLPLVGRLIPIVADEYSDPEKGTGAVKITPAHDFNDFEVGKRHESEGVLPPINVLDAEARVALQGNMAFFAGLPDDYPYEQTIAAVDGKPRESARKVIIEMMEARGFLDKIEPHAHMVPHGDRSGVAIEPWLTEQWYVKAEVLAGPALAAVRENKTKFIPENWEKTYFQWLENVQPWCISRQLWWGHQIPAWYGRKKNEFGTFDLDWEGPEIFVAATEVEAIRIAEQKNGCEIRVLDSPPAGGLDPIFQQIIEDELANKPHWEPLWRDPDVLDTWFSSALWPFSTLGWPDETPELNRYYPTNSLVTGFDIIFFWVARMMMMGLHFMRDVPFHDVYIHALVRDERGAKMSKSKGNVIDPLHLIDEYGADSLRFTLAAMAAQGRDIKLSTQRVEGYRNFATKLWNAARFAEINGCLRPDGFDPRDLSVTLNRWIVGEAAKAIAEVTEAIGAYRFNDAANAAYRFVWNIFCDWYLELAKTLLQGTNEAAKRETQAATSFVLDEILKLLHPFMPFITEELWSIESLGGAGRKTCLALAPWPTSENCEDSAAEAEIGFVIDVVSEVRSVRSEMNVPAGAQIPLVFVAADPGTVARAKTWEEIIKRLARLSEISFAPEPPPHAAQMVVRGTLAALPLEGIIDFAAEKDRLQKEIDKLTSDAKKIEAKLGNADFVARAPEEVVEENRERFAEMEARRGKLAAALRRLGG